MLFSSHVFSVNSRPHGSGAFKDQKERLLNVFFALYPTYKDCPSFEETYGPLIAKDFGMPFETEADKEEVYDAIPGRLSSFTGMLEQPKAGRWFSWNGLRRRMNGGVV